ncbi:rod shape-determining protein MreC [Fulvivirgaceae bacterium BMA10]|uniref:Cell shape-determining protein MreC n=1 Tax=Splendidivirga corallicola TaxID=3051826 RepID=A0ABT8KVK1_9BACT|nr:rod shape-determining protein MreC [Fulvivirgaceae bacterium BMA10]
MQSLFLFLHKYRAFFIFVLLEVGCMWLIISNNQYQSATFFNSSNRIAGSILNTKSGITDYFSLKQANENLATENARLREEVMKQREIIDRLPRNVALNLILGQFDYSEAKVINNSIRNLNNYITVNKGWADGIEPGMGVIGQSGLVGIVKSSSKHFSTIISLLHTDIYVSSLLKRTGDLSSTKWAGDNPEEANLMFVPRHVDVKEGDTVITSGYNSIFGQGTMIGTVNNVSIKENATFYDIKVALSTDFSSLSYVYIVKNNLKVEKDSLEIATNRIQ